MTTTIVQNSFLPTSIPGCQLWLDAADTSTITGTSPVTAWQDKSGTGRTVSFTGTNTYTSSPASVNTNIASSYLSANVDVRKTTVPNVSLFLVYKWNSSASSGSNQFLWGGDVGGGWNRIQILTFPAGTSFQYQLAYTGSSPYATTVTGINNGNLVLYNANYAYGVGNGTFVNVNGSLSTSLVTEGAASSQTSYTGINFGNGNGDIAFASSVSFSEIIIYYGILTTLQRQQVEGYLAWKWGLQANLPLTQPYKNSPAVFVTQPITLTGLNITNRINSASFLPTTIPGCQLWLDAADPNGNGVIPANGSSVSTWRDKSGTANNMSLTSGTVTYNSSTKAVNFPNGGNGIMTSANSTTFTLNQSVVFVVCEVTGSGYVFACPNITPYGGSLGDYAIRFGGTTTLISLNSNDLGFGTAYYVNGTLGVPSGGVITIPATPNIIYGLFNTTGTSTFTLSSSFGGRYFIGNIQEVLVYTGPITTAQRQQVEGYLAWKWGLQGSLPPTHPYKNTSAVFVTQPTILAALGINPYNSMMISSYFNPKSISGLQFWIDGADRTSMTFASANTISAWNDKSGNGYNLSQSTSAYQPIYSSNYINLGTASNYYMNMPQGAVNNASSWSLFFVINPVNSTNWIMAKQWDGINSLNILSITYNGFRSSGTTGVVYFKAQNAATLFSGPAALTTNSVQLISMIYDGTNMYYYLNGNLGSTTAGSFGILNENRATACTLGAWIVAAGLENSGTTNFKLGELQFFNNAITTTQRQKNEGYLAWKWGLQGSLPSTNPYKGYPPPP